MSGIEGTIPGSTMATETTTRRVHQQLWLLAFAVVIPLVYVLFFVLTWFRVGPKDFDQFLVFHQLQYWNHALFGLAKQWTPVMCGGLSMAGEPQVPLMSLSMLLAYVVGPLYGIKIACILYLIIGWVGAYLYAGVWQNQTTIRSVAASLFVGNGFFFYRIAIGHIDFIPFLVLPLALWILHQALLWRQNESWKRSLVRELQLIVMYGGALAMVVDGSPVAVIHLLLWIGLYALVLSWYARSMLPLIILGGALIIATLLDAGYLWPMLVAQSEFPRHTADVFTNPLGLIIHALLPLRGKITHGVGKGHELTIFIGPILAILMWRYRQRIRNSLPRNVMMPLMIVSAISIVLGMGSLQSLHVPDWLSPFDILRPLPGFRSIGVTARYWGFLALPVSLFAAIALYHFVIEHPIRRVSVWLTIALVIQVSAQTEVFWSKWHSGRIYQAASLQNYFHGRAENLSYVSAPTGSLQGEWITPRQGVCNCYDMDDFIRAPVVPGNQMIVAESTDSSVSRNSTQSKSVDSPMSTLTAGFRSWNELYVRKKNTKPTANDDEEMLTITLNQAWNRYWRAPGCKILRGENDLLTIQCSEANLSKGINVYFDDELSTVAATVSQRAWSWLIVLVATSLLGTLLIRSNVFSVPNLVRE